MRLSKSYWGYDASFMDRFMDIFGLSKKCIREFSIYCCQIDGHLIGFYGFKINEYHQCELDVFFLHPDYIGKGLGRHMWGLVLQTARTLGALEFVIWADPHAQSFYLKMRCTNIGSCPSPLLPNRHVPLLNIL